MLAIACARSGYDDPALMSRVAELSIRWLDEGRFTPREVANLAYSYGKLSLKCRPVAEAIGRRAKRQLKEFSSQELSNMLFGMVISETYDAQLFRDIYAQAQNELPDAISWLALLQLYQAWVVLSAECPDAVSEVDDAFLARLHAAWDRVKKRPKESSEHHRAISACLMTLSEFRCCVNHVTEAEHDIDIALLDRRLAVEVHGPTHFACNTRRPLGHTLLKNKMLQLQGWGVVQIPYWEWERIPHWSTMEKKRYLQRKLEITAPLKYSNRDTSYYKPYIPHAPAGKLSRFD